MFSHCFLRQWLAFVATATSMKRLFSFLTVSYFETFLESVCVWCGKLMPVSGAYTSIAANWWMGVARYTRSHVLFSIFGLCCSSECCVLFGHVAKVGQCLNIGHAKPIME